MRAAILFSFFFLCPVYSFTAKLSVYQHAPLPSYQSYLSHRHPHKNKPLGSNPTTLRSISVSLDSPILPPATTFSPYNSYPAVSPSPGGGAVRWLVSTAVKAVWYYAGILLVAKVVKAWRGEEEGEDADVADGVYNGGENIISTLGVRSLQILCQTWKLTGRIFEAILPHVVHHQLRLLLGKVQRLTSMIRKQYVKRIVRPSPMVLRGDDWGVARLVSRSEVTKGSGYYRCRFSIGRGETLGLSMGQQVNLCCLSRKNEVVKAGFHPTRLNSVGTFDILTMSPICPTTGLKRRAEIEAVLGREQGRFHWVVGRELKIGDEVALKPGRNSLEYRGEALPVTDMVFFVSGLGISAVLSQLEKLLPRGVGSVGTVSVIWVNEEEGEFGVGYDELERQFYKYNKILDVSCVLQSDIYSANFADNRQVGDAVPDFSDGTMAIIAGPDYFVKKANYFLQGRGFPAEVICSLD